MSAGVDDEGGREESAGDATGTPKWPVVGLLLAVLWLFVRGVAPGETLAATLETVLGEFIIGLAVGLPIAFALRRYYLPRVSVGRAVRVAPYAALYFVVFVRELVTANVDVAYRVLAPSMPIRPDVIAIPLRVESDGAVTTIANSITLTPGTLTMDHDAETNTLYVHAIAAKNRESIVEPIRTWEDYALVIFEGRDPNTEIPRKAYGSPMTGPAGSPDDGERPTGGEAGPAGDREGERTPPQSSDGDAGARVDRSGDDPQERADTDPEDTPDGGGDRRGR
ncbi:MAG: Na+/H+ antiporter subunit E [Haloarculaceae archaeon]